MNYPDLPVSAAREEVLTAMQDHQVVVVVGDTGSGKTTQLPKMALEYLKSNITNARKHKKVGCTQPRRIAAASVAKRVADEMQVTLGQEVGYQVRFDDVSSKDTILKFMTDGILLAETQGDASLEEYGVIIIDEAHERSLNIDFLLGYLKRLLKHRKDLKVMISSATLDAGGFSEFYDGAPMINVEGRTFPVETLYLAQKDNEDLARQVARAVKSTAQGGDLGDVLVFLPGEREIRECAEVLEGRNIAQTEILPLYARMGMAEQQRVFNTKAGVKRVVLATNVAETSLTIPGIVFVVDTGVARVSRWNPSRQVQRLQIEKISQASANQRKGRCGRVSEGICLRLYEEDDFDERPEFTDPEIRRSSLGGVILRMKSLKLPEIADFPFLDPPSSKHISEGYRTLREIGALDDEDELTDAGWKLAKIPVEPRLGRMLLESVRVGCYEEMLVIVSGLSVIDPRERPSDRQQEADTAHKKWDDEESDFTSILHLWKDLMGYSDKKGWQRNQLRKFCKRSYLNFRRVMEWGNLLRELRQVRIGVGAKNKSGDLGDMQSWASHELLHKALLIGMPRQVGKFDKENRAYKGVSAKEFAIFPGSGMFGQKKPEWILAYDMVDTSRLWARRVAKIEPQWLEDIVPHLCRYRYHGAKWDRKQGAVYAKEVVVFGPLKIVEGRNVHFGRIDPEASWKIFIREGLIGGGLHFKPKCLRKLDSLRDKVAAIEQKLRRVGGIWSDEKIIDFFEENLPKNIFTTKAFLKWEQEQGESIILEMEDVMYDDPNELLWSLKGYPDLVVDELSGGQEYSIYYRVAPNEPDDGVTIGVHVDQLINMSSDIIDWGIPGLLEERVFLLIRSLPKGQRVACNPAAERATEFVDWIQLGQRFGKGNLYRILGDYLTDQTGITIEPKMFHVEKLPAELITKVWVCDDDGNELMMGRNISEIRKKLSVLLDERFEAESGAEWELSGMKEWECDALPEYIEVRGKRAFPALVDEGATVGIKVYLTAWEAQKSHLEGCARLFLLEHTDHAKYVSKNLPVSTELKMYLPLIGGKGVNQVEFLRCSILGIFTNQIPRDAESFSEMSHNGRGELYQYTEQLGQILQQVVTISREIETFISENKDDQHLGEIAEDLRGQLDWLLRSGFILEAGWQSILRYPTYFKGMQQRIQRLRSLPVMRDLEKMDKVLELLIPWEEVFKLRPDDGDLIECGYLLEEWRLAQFVPETVIKGAVSIKKLKQALATVGVMV